MSWIIQSLLNSKNFIYEVRDIESDDYNDLLLIEKTIKDLREIGTLSQDDLDLIAEMSGDVSGFENKPKHEKEVAFKKYTTLCNKVAERMGDYFTDEGYVIYMKEKHGLNEEQVEVIKNFISSKYKHKIPRKTHRKLSLQGTDND